MNVGIVGSRSFSDYKLFKEIIKKLNLNIDLIISGGARGADSLAKQYALENNIPIKIFYPDWGKIR